jgi:hypothetical protein
MTRLQVPRVGPKRVPTRLEASTGRFIRSAVSSPLDAYDGNVLPNGNITRGVSGWATGIATGTTGVLSAVLGNNGNTNPDLNFGAFSLQVQEAANSRTQVWSTPVIALESSLYNYSARTFKAEAVLINEAASAHWASTTARLTFVCGANESGAGSPYAAAGDPDQTRFIVGTVAPNAVTGISTISGNFTLDRPASSAGVHKYCALIVEWTAAPAVSWSWRADRLRLQVRAR